jgi:hypothetical protein
MGAEEDEEEVGRVLADEDGDDGDSGEEQGEDLRELLAEGRGVPELAAGEGGVTPENDEAVYGDHPEDGERGKVAGEVKEEGQRDSQEEEEEFG